MSTSRAERIARVAQRLGHGEIRVVQLHVFADEADVHAVLARFDARATMSRPTR